MNIIKRSNAGYQCLPLEAALLSRRIVFLEGPITSESVSLVIKQLLYLESEDEHSRIKFVINSEGGSVSAGLVLYHQLRAMEVPIDIIGEERCMSMAAILLAGGKPGHRFLLKGCECMIHEPRVLTETSGISGSVTSIQQAAESILNKKEMLDELLAMDTGHTIEEIKKYTTYDHFISDIEALAFNMADAIVDRI